MNILFYDFQRYQAIHIKKDLDDESFVQLLGEKYNYEDIFKVLVGMARFINGYKRELILTKETN